MRGLERIFILSCCVVGVTAAGLLAACNPRIYARGGITDGDTFFIPTDTVSSPDPVIQSWIGYGVARSRCQLETKTANPARANSFTCELQGRRVLTDVWMKQKFRKPGASDDYLDLLDRVGEEGFMEEYVWHYFNDSSWRKPHDLESARFATWLAENLSGHKPQTRWVGAWGYKEPRHRASLADSMSGEGVRQ